MRFVESFQKEYQSNFFIRQVEDTHCYLYGVFLMDGVPRHPSDGLAYFKSFVAARKWAAEAKPEHYLTQHSNQLSLEERVVRLEAVNENLRDMLHDILDKLP